MGGYARVFFSRVTIGIFKGVIGDGFGGIGMRHKQAIFVPLNLEFFMIKMSVCLMRLVSIVTQINMSLEYITLYDAK